VLPAESCEIVDNWEVAGLRGTGSHDVSANQVVVPQQHLFSAKDFPHHDGPLWRLPFFTLCAVLMAGFPLGVGRRALDELAVLAASKVRPPSRVAIAEDGDLQMALARAEGGLRSARAFVFDALGALWDSALRGDVPETSVRADFLLSVHQAMWAALAATDSAFSYAGAAALRLDHPVQRCFRDLHAASQHTLFTPASAKRYARARLGLAQDTSWF
jgi:indole-3-acetate monooxygenase